MAKVFLILLLFSPILTIDTTCGGNCPTGMCSSCPCGNKTNPIDVDKFCRSYSKWDFDCCKCIVEQQNPDFNSNFCNTVNDYPRGHWECGFLPINEAFMSECKVKYLWQLCSESAILKCSTDLYEYFHNSFEAWHQSAAECQCRWRGKQLESE